MRKITSIFLAISILLLISVAIADVDISGLSYDELLSLQKNLIEEIMSRPEWKEVSVPAGEWIIGQDIPSGYYCVKSKERLNVIRIEDTEGSAAGLYKTLDEDEIVGKAEFKDGLIFTCSGLVLLSPPISLGF